MPELFDHFGAMIGGIPKEPEVETELIVGFRSWKLIDGPEGIPLLYSMAQDCCWPPYEALHASFPDNQPGLSNSAAGIFAFNKEELAPSYSDFGEGAYIMGAVYLWGEVIEHQEGYRAQYAYPKELWVSKEFDAAMIVRLEETYGVPVVIREDLPLQISPPVPTTFRSGSTGILQGILEVTKDCVYDREAMQGKSRLMLFTIAFGQMTQSAKDGFHIVKTYSRTNMYQCGALDAPRKLAVEQIRCTFFEDGKPLPVSDPIYWDAHLRFETCGKSYWNGPAAYAADPLVILANTDWSKIPFEHAEKIVERLTLSLQSEMPSNKFGGCAFGLSAGTSSPVDGVLLEQQQPFTVRIEVDEPVSRPIEVLVGLIGTGARAVV
jgi:hypothetical protein